MGGFKVCRDQTSGNYVTLDPDDIEPYLINNDIKISEKEILDRSKGDVLSKSLVVLQITWFMVQTLARTIQHLAITELEVATLAFALLNIVIYFCWWNKPLNVNCPILIAAYHQPVSSTHNTSPNSLTHLEHLRVPCPSIEQSTDDFEGVNATSNSDIRHSSSLRSPTPIPVIQSECTSLSDSPQHSSNDLEKNNATNSSPQTPVLSSIPLPVVSPTCALAYETFGLTTALPVEEEQLPSSALGWHWMLARCIKLIKQASWGVPQRARAIYSAWTRTRPALFVNFVIQALWAAPNALISLIIRGKRFNLGASYLR
ncbi:hypothetical protein H0H92_002010 [Tricholoma furcatifolium]|nr:hypothetical protein H0H92_002010 [Tricholoma furcatifolium]